MTAADGERNYLAIVALFVALILVIAFTAAFVVWHRHADDPRFATSSPLPPPTPSLTLADPTSVPTTTATATTSELPDNITDHSFPRGLERKLITTPSAPDPTSAIPNATSTISRLRPGFRACYNKGLAADPDLQGSITIAITVAPNGDVTNATKKSGGLSPDVDACMLRKAKNATFDASPSGGTVSVPIQFVRQR